MIIAGFANNKNNEAFAELEHYFVCSIGMDLDIFSEKKAGIYPAFILIKYKTLCFDWNSNSPMIHIGMGKIPFVFFRNITFEH